MIKIGLTGGIGSGKTIVASLFKTMGIPVYDADSAAKRLVNESAELRTQILNEFGSQSYDNNNTYNRSYIASIVFSDPSKMELLSKIIHPFTIADSDKWFQQQQGAYAIKEAAVLFESGADKHVDFIIGVSAPLHLRIQRVMQRDLISELQTMNRIKSQMDEQKKMKLCDAIIINDEKTSLITQVLHLHHELMNKSVEY